MRFQFNPEFKNQDNDRYAVFMNSVKSQPFGYVVLQEHLDNSLENPFYYESFELNKLSLAVDNPKEPYAVILGGDTVIKSGTVVNCNAFIVK